MFKNKVRFTMSELIQIKGRAVGIEQSKAKLTNGQLALLALMKRKIKANEVITKDDVKDIYVKHVQRNKHVDYKFISTSKDGSSKYVTEKCVYTEAYNLTVSEQWFRINLGSLILKAKLIAIPVIDID